MLQYLPNFLYSILSFVLLQTVKLYEVKEPSIVEKLDLALIKFEPKTDEIKKITTIIVK